MITVTPADIQDRDAGRDVFWRLRLTQPQITQVWADRGYTGDLVDWARDHLWLTLRIVSRPKGTPGSEWCQRFDWVSERCPLFPLDPRRIRHASGTALLGIGHSRRRRRGPGQVGAQPSTMPTAPVRVCRPRACVML
ncbi:hypothetical protein ABZ614_20350 [Streptomyces sp. NPDC013178]|uniref:hypothetical protein n=1 Tax=Streptomyces sp. NPDC013178 TaxID=3155118 RepID=UPI0033D1BBF7